MFNKREQNEKMNNEQFLTENRILPEALQQLENHLGVGWKTAYTPYEEQWALGDNEIIIKQAQYDTQVEKYRATAIVQKEFREQHLVKILDKLRNFDKKQNVIIVGEKIYPKIKDFLKERNIAYLDTAGNCFIKNDNIFIDINGKKIKNYYENAPNRAFTKTGLKLVFHILMNENLINDPYRQIAETTKVATGTIKFVINGLLEEGFLIKNNTGYKLTNVVELEDRWATAYGERLKPTLAMGRFRFLNPNDFIHWRELPFDNNKIWWGGEPAGALYTNFLKPGELTIYTTEKRNDLINKYKLIPDPEGNVVIFQKFWQTKDDDHGNKVPPFLAYADLILTNNNRCIDIATDIYEKFLTKNI